MLLSRSNQHAVSLDLPLSNPFWWFVHIMDFQQTKLTTEITKTVIFVVIT